ncbi:TPA: hypothetical protein DCX15_01130, partial [bacterium]|nr:hypothetical protein [bacterium]
MSGKELDFMRLAIDEARNSKQEKGKTPLYVGAVVVKDGEILAQAHRGEISQGEHAEYTALERKLPHKDLSGATIYTTLEPCTTRNHPKVPCAKRIVQRRLGRVVIGILDPNPNIRGEGVWTLTENEVIVEHAPHKLQEEIRKLNQEFIDEQRNIKLEPEVLKKRPWMEQKINIAGSQNVTIIQAGGDVHYHEAERDKKRSEMNMIDESIDHRIEALLNKWPISGDKTERTNKKSEVLNWLNNFEPSEIEDMLLILENLDVVSQYRINQLLEGLSEELQKIFGNSLSMVRVFPLGDSPSSSGGNYLYNLRKKLGISEGCCPYKHFNEIDLSGVKALIFIDDIIGSGNQATRFAKNKLSNI